MANESSVPFIYSSILYFAGFFLFLEWLHPIKIISENNNITVFITYAALCFVVSLFRIHWTIGFLLKISGLTIILHALFFTERILSKLWFKEVYLELYFNFQVIFSNQMAEVTSFLRTLLFLIIIWMMSYLVHYWFVTMRRVFIFVFFTFLYVTILDTFTIYNGFFPIVRTFIISFIALGIAHQIRKMTSENLDIPLEKQLRKWFIPLIAGTLIATTIGIIAPSYDPQWPDPVPFIKSAANIGGEGSGSGPRKVGYGSNDSNLGGSFIQDYTTVFHATVRSKQYWRIESKDVYTGKGWERSAAVRYTDQDEEQIDIPFYEENVKLEEAKAVVKFNSKNALDKVVYPYGLTKVDTIEGVALSADAVAGLIQAKIRDEVVKLQQYTLQFDEATYQIDSLREVTGGDPESLVNQYTTIPETLPDRVGELAAEIIADIDNRYDQAKAIEQYFHRNGFEYETKDVSFPAEDEDYVDQFLFDTKIGYCDNYSTSMVVMLRTQGIPARWVKGFTGGEELSNDEGIKEFKIANANAHSWVEVYFPGSGWVPFEPTQGFDNQATFRYASFDQPEVETPDLNEIEQDDENLDEEMPTPEMEDLGPTSEVDEITETSKSKYYLGFLIAALAIIVFILYRTRLKWQTMILHYKWQQNPNEEMFVKSYLFLLKLLGKYTIPRKQDQTLREYAKQIDERYYTENMSKLTKKYEEILYNKQGKKMVGKEFIPIWKDLVDHLKK